MPKQKRDRGLLVVGVGFIVAIVIGVVFAISQLPNDPQGSSAVAASAVVVQVPADFTGTWKTVDDIAPKMAAKISGNRIEIEYIQGESHTGYWYGTWDAPRTKVNRVMSKAVDGGENGGRLYLSSAGDKEFIYEGGMLTFQMSAGASTVKVMMKRA